MNEVNVAQQVGCVLVPKEQVEKEKMMQNASDVMDPKGKFQIEHLDKDGNLKATYDMSNGITDVGKDLLLNVMFNDAVQIAQASWYIGLIDISGFTGLADDNLMSSHNGWNEFVSFDEATRVAWGSGTTTTQSTTNASPATFNINGAGTVKGVFITSVSTKSGSTGTLWATALFAADVPVTGGDQLKVTYTVSC